MAEELKPCPICGRTPFMFDLTATDRIGYEIMCELDGNHTVSAWSDNSMADAIAAWNTRHEPATEVYPANAYHEDYGAVLWFPLFPVDEPPVCAYGPGSGDDEFDPDYHKFFIRFPTTNFILKEHP